MAEFPPNLDDGELWLPSDIFLNDAGATKDKYSPRRCFSPVDELSRSFSAAALLPTDHPEPPAFRVPPRFQRGVRPVQNRSFTCSPLVRNLGPMECGSVVRDKFEHRNITLTDAPELCYQYYLLRQAQLQVAKVDAYAESGARAFQLRHESSFHNRVLPSQGRIRKVCGGTGVFLPRVAQNTPISTVSDIRRNQGPRNKLNTQITRPVSSIMRVAEVSKQEEYCCNCKFSSEMILPRGWTYGASTFPPFPLRREALSGN